MGYHKRGSNFYYYRKEWRDGRCVCVYVGKGPQAEAAHAEMHGKWAARVEADIRQISLQEFDRAAVSLVELEFLANGYHRLYGVWRRRNRRTLTPAVEQEIRLCQVALEAVKADLRAARPDLDSAICGVHPLVLRALASGCRAPRRRSMLLAQLALRAREPFADRTNYAEKTNPGAIPAPEDARHLRIDGAQASPPRTAECCEPRPHN